MSESASNQILNVVGELRINAESAYKEANGLISFYGPFGTKLGQIRSFGYGFGTTFLLDGSECYGGIAFRIDPNDGDSMIGGKGDQYAIVISRTDHETKIRNLLVSLESNQFNPNLPGSAIFRVKKSNTNKSSSLLNSIVEITQNSMRVGEHMLFNFGPSSYGGCSVWGYAQPTSTNDSDVNNYSYFSMVRNGTAYQCIKMLPTGNVQIPTRLDVETISATTYLNLPSVPASDLLPLTLDKQNNHVGINNTIPTEALEVTGNAKISGSINATTYLNLPPVPASEVLPMTLDKTNNRVGINNTSPSCALDVTGDVIFDVVGAFEVHGDTQLFGTMTASTVYATTYQNLPPVPSSQFLPLTLDTTNSRIGINQTSPLEALDVTGNIQASGSVLAPQIDTDDVLATNITTSTINAGTYLNLPPVNLLPITLDKVNNRVGINNTSPQYSLQTDVIAANSFVSKYTSMLGSSQIGWGTSVNLPETISGAQSTTTTITSVTVPSIGVYMIDLTVCVTPGTSVGSTTVLTIPSFSIGCRRTEGAANDLLSPFPGRNPDYYQTIMETNVVLPASTNVWAKTRILSNSWVWQFDTGGSLTFYIQTRYNADTALDFKIVGSSRSTLTYTRIC